MTAPETDCATQDGATDEPPPEPDGPETRITPRVLARAGTLALAGTVGAVTGQDHELPGGLADPHAVDETLAWLLFGGAGIGLLVATLGAITAAALLTYSPTRLARLRGGEALRDQLEDESLEFQLVARTLTLLGLMTATLCTWVGTWPSVTWPLVILILLAVLLCGVAPARLAEIRAESILTRSVPLLRPLRTVLRLPFLVPLNAVAGGVLQVLRLTDRSNGNEPDVVADEILTAVSDSAHDAELPDEERHWIENIVELKSLHASEVMTPRPDVVGLPRNMPITEATAKAMETGYSRYPVFGDSPDDVVGIFYAKDALGLLLADRDLDRSEVVVGELMRERTAVPETMPLDELLRHFRGTKRQLAIVQDEYGGTSGIVTLEDVLEEIVGDIEDEHDPEAELWVHVLEEGRQVEAAGRARVDEVNEHLGDRLPQDEHYDTVGGWVFTRLGRVPAIGETLELDGMTIEIVQADERRVARLRITIPSAVDPTASPGNGNPGS